MVTIITGTTNKPVSSDRLKSAFKSNSELNGYLYIGYPIIGTIEGAYPIDALWVSEEKGIIIFNLIEGKNIEGYQEAQDDSYNRMESKLKGHRELVERRKLQVELNVVTFAPALLTIPSCDEYPICNEDNLLNLISQFSWENSDLYRQVVSVVQSVSMIRKGKKKREIVKSESRGAKLQKIEDSIANLDNAQGRAVIETVEGVQRIRGLAGSGKTIVIALKAAYLHAQHPEWRIAVTFNTRSLKGQLKQLIRAFYLEQASSEPDWENLQIVHAWGSSVKSPGIYYNFCVEHNVEYHNYLSAKHKYGANTPFLGVCKEALDAAERINPTYDAILIDEAQDFPIEFLRMCYEILHEPKRLVYAYDELQNLNLQSLPSPEDIFGYDENGRPKVRFEIESGKTNNQDIILEKCYRNSRPALVTAHALGFGIYRKPDRFSETGLVQMFEQNTLWNDVGYSVEEGLLQDGEHVVLKRTDDSSPEFLENHSPIDDLVLFKTFGSKEEQDQWVANEIIKNLSEDELRADDIIVINPDPLTTRDAVIPIRKTLYDNGVNNHIAGVDNSPDVFFDLDNPSVTFAGIYRAKGNEAAMVYVVNAQDCNRSSEYDFVNADKAKMRNKLFTAITRSKAWVRVVGYGKDMDGLIEEYQKVKEKGFALDFIYPTAEQRKQLNIVNRDMSSAEKENIARTIKSVDGLLQDIESGRLYVEDLGSDMIERLKKLLK